MDDQAVEGVAHADPAGLGVGDDADALREVAIGIKIGVDDAGTGFDARDLGIVADKVDETAAATGDDEVHEAVGLQHFLGRFVRGRKQVDGVLRHAGFREDLPPACRLPRGPA